MRGGGAAPPLTRRAAPMARERERPRSGRPEEMSQLGESTGREWSGGGRGGLPLAHFCEAKGSALPFRV